MTPRLTAEAGEVLRVFYLELRRQSGRRRRLAGHGASLSTFEARSLWSIRQLGIVAKLSVLHVVCNAGQDMARKSCPLLMRKPDLPSTGRVQLQARQLESLVRLAEARARVELSQTVTAEHAQVYGCYCISVPSKG